MASEIAGTKDVGKDVRQEIRNAINPYRIGMTCIFGRTCSPHKLGQTLDVVSAMRRITMIYQRLAKVFLICSDFVRVP